MIRDVYISALEPAEDEPHEPPAHVRNVAVVGTVATLGLFELGDNDRLQGDPVAHIRVPAQSPLLALQGLVADQSD